jgi:hypothetical protein
MNVKNLLWMLLGIAVLAGCRDKGPSASHAQLTDGSEPLRAAFNADVGKVRVLMLVAPT